MATLIREERYILRSGTEENILRVQELVWGSESWPERFRVELPAAHGHKPAKFYGTSAREVVELAADFLASAGPALAGTITLRLDERN